MKLPAAAYSAEVATSATKAGAAGYLAKFSEAATLLRQGYGDEGVENKFTVLSPQRNCQETADRGRAGR